MANDGRRQEAQPYRPAGVSPLQRAVRIVILATMALLLSAAVLKSLNVPRNQIQLVLVAVALIAMWIGYRIMARHARERAQATAEAHRRRSEPTLH